MKNSVFFFKLAYIQWENTELNKMNVQTDVKQVFYIID